MGLAVLVLVGGDVEHEWSCLGAVGATDGDGNVECCVLLLLGRGVRPALGVFCFVFGMSIDINAYIHLQYLCNIIA